MGDRILALVAKLLSESTEHAYRIGGDQYAVVDMDPDGAEDFRPALKLVSDRQLGVRVSVSGGGVIVDRDYLVASEETVNTMPLGSFIQFFRGLK